MGNGKLDVDSWNKEKIPQKGRGYARYSRCGHAEVRQLLAVYLLTFTYQDAIANSNTQ